MEKQNDISKRKRFRSSRNLLIRKTKESSHVETCIHDCVECAEDYFETERIEDWVKCII